MAALVRLAVADARGELPTTAARERCCGAACTCLGIARRGRDDLRRPAGQRRAACAARPGLVLAGAHPLRAWRAGARARSAAPHRDACRRDGGRPDRPGGTRAAGARCYEEAARLLADRQAAGRMAAVRGFQSAVALARAGREGGAALLDRLGRARTRDWSWRTCAIAPTLHSACAARRRRCGRRARGARSCTARKPLRGARACSLRAGPRRSRRDTARRWAPGAPCGRPDLGRRSARGDAGCAMGLAPARRAWRERARLPAAAEACEAELGPARRRAPAGRGDALLKVALADESDVRRLPLGAFLQPGRRSPLPRRGRGPARPAPAAGEPARVARSLVALRDMVVAGVRASTAWRRVSSCARETMSSRCSSSASTSGGQASPARARGSIRGRWRPGERRLLLRLARSRRGSRRCRPAPSGTQLDARLRRLDGALHWQLNHEWPERFHAAERVLRAAQAELSQAQAGTRSLAASLAAGRKVSRASTRASTPLRSASRAARPRRAGPVAAARTSCVRWRCRNSTSASCGWSRTSARRASRWPRPMTRPPATGGPAVRRARRGGRPMSLAAMSSWRRVSGLSAGADPRRPRSRTPARVDTVASAPPPPPTRSPPLRPTRLFSRRRPPPIRRCA
jgi:hypothetical protein